MSDTQNEDTTVRPDPKRWLAMGVVSLAVSIIIMDATIVNVILPLLIQDLSLSVSEAEWINSIYALVFAALLITVGRAGDLFGRRRLLLVGIVIFVAASALAAASGSGTMLLTARLLHHIPAPATDSSLGIQFLELFDQVAAVEVAGGFACYHVVTHTVL